MADTQTLTWHNDPALKQKALDGMRAHRAADELVKGHYIKVNGSFSGCAVGCVLRDLSGVNSIQGSAHNDYAEVAGLPVWVAQLHDHFFENLPHPDNQQFAEDLIDAIPVGVDLTPAYHRYMTWLLTDDQHGSRQYANDAGKAATDTIVRLHERASSGDLPSQSEWAAARAAAGAAAGDAAGYAARAAAGAAAWAAARAAAGAAAWAAAGAAARAAAWDAARAAAGHAAWDAARAAAGAAQSKALLRILAEQT